MRVKEAVKDLMPKRIRSRSPVTVKTREKREFVFHPPLHPTNITITQRRAVRRKGRNMTKQVMQDERVKSMKQRCITRIPFLLRLQEILFLLPPKLKHLLLSGMNRRQGIKTIPHFMPLLLHQPSLLHLLWKRHPNNITNWNNNNN